MDYLFVVACFRKVDAVAVVVEIAVDWARDPFGSDFHPLQLTLQYLARVLMDPGTYLGAVAAAAVVVVAVVAVVVVVTDDHHRTRNPKTQTKKSYSIKYSTLFKNNYVVNARLK